MIPVHSIDPLMTGHHRLKAQPVAYVHTHSPSVRFQQLEGEVKLDRLGWVANCLSLVDYHLTASQSNYKGVRAYAHQ